MIKARIDHYSHPLLTSISVNFDMENQITLKHSFFQNFIYSINAVAIIVIIAITLINGFEIKIMLLPIVLIAVSYFLFLELKRLRILVYSNGILKTISFDKKEELVDLSSIRSIILTGGRISNFYVYKIVYETPNQEEESFLTAPLRDDRFTCFIKDVKLVNKSVRIKRTFP